MNEREHLAYRLWSEARAMEEKGNHEASDPLRNRAPYWFGQATGFERAAWMVLASSGEPVDAEFFTKADAARLAAMTG
jgi:hypothetical protein